MSWCDGCVDKHGPGCYESKLLKLAEQAEELDGFHRLLILQAERTKKLNQLYIEVHPIDGEDFYTADLGDMADWAAGEIERLEKRLEQAEKDTERLDYLEGDKERSWKTGNTLWFAGCLGGWAIGGIPTLYKTARAAIDAAREQR